MRLRTIALASFITIWTTQGIAATTHRTALVERIQTDSHTRPGYEDTFWVLFTGAWPGTTCAVNWVWFNAKENPQLVATVLLAKSTQTPLQIYVDDSLVKKDGNCQVFTMSM